MKSHLSACLLADLTFCFAWQKMRRTFTERLLKRASILSLGLCCSVLPYSQLMAETVLERAENIYSQATTSETWFAANDRNSSYRWNEGLLSIYIDVSVEDPKGVITRIRDEFSEDLAIFTTRTNLDYEIGIWNDRGGPQPIYILLGDYDSIWERMDKLEAAFEIPKMAETILRQHRSESGVCFGSFGSEDSSSNKQNKPISFGLILADSSRETNLCLRRQLMIVSGIVGDLPNEVASVLSVSLKHEKFTPVDKALLQAHYRSKNLTLRQSLIKYLVTHLQ